MFFFYFVTLTFGIKLGVIQVHAPTNFHDLRCYSFEVIKLTSSIFFYRQKAMHKSPPCISTGGLKKKQTNNSLRFVPKEPKGDEILYKYKMSCA